MSSEVVHIHFPLLWPPYVIGGPLYFWPVVSIFFFFFSSPNLSGHRLDVCTWRGPSVNLECRSEMCCMQLAANTGRKKSRQKSPSGHHRTTLSGYIFANKAMYRQSEKNLLSSNISSTCPHNMVNFGPLAAEIVSLVWGTPANFKGFGVLAALMHGTLALGVSQTLRRWTEGATYIRQGDHHVGHWPTF